MEDSERRALERMVWSAARFETTARLLLDMSWIVDDISDDETSFISMLYVMNQVDGYTALSERLLDMEWIVDGVSNDDYDMGVNLLYFSRQVTEDLATRLMDMPFLQTIEPADRMALFSLWHIAEESPDDFADLLAYPQLKDGITDDQTMIVAMLPNVLEFAPSRVGRLLDPSAVERRMVELPISGEVELAIVRAYRGGVQRSRSMDLLENAVREAEKLMGAPLPLSHNAVWLLFENVGPLAGGINAGGDFMIIRPEYDSDSASFTPFVIAHEVAHYYWLFGPDWIVEGMAVIMEAVIEGKRVGRRVRATYKPCGIVKNIMELEATEPSFGFLCDYWLGEGLFLDLMRRLGEDAFWEGARELHEITRTKWEDGIEVGIEDVRQAFGPDAERTISRWYGE